MRKQTIIRRKVLEWEKVSYIKKWGDSEYEQEYLKIKIRGVKKEKISLSLSNITLCKMVNTYLSDPFIEFEPEKLFSNRRLLFTLEKRKYQGKMYWTIVDVK